MEKGEQSALKVLPLWPGLTINGTHLPDSPKQQTLFHSHYFSKTGCVARRQHFTFHLPGIICALTCEPDFTQSGPVYLILSRHQRIGISARQLLAEHIKLGHAQLIKISQGDAGFCIPVSIPPYTFEGLQSKADNIPSITSSDISKSSLLHWHTEARFRIGRLRPRQ